MNKLTIRDLHAHTLTVYNITILNKSSDINKLTQQLSTALRLGWLGRYRYPALRVRIRTPFWRGSESVCSWILDPRLFFSGTPFLHSVFCIHATFQQLWSEDLFARIRITFFSGSNTFPDPTLIFTDPNIILQFKHLDPQINFFQAGQTCPVQCHSLSSFATCRGTSSITFRWVNWSDFSD